MSIHTLTVNTNITPKLTDEHDKFSMILDILHDYARLHKLKLIPESSNHNSEQFYLFIDNMNKNNIKKAHRDMWTLCLPGSGLKIIMIRTRGKNLKKSFFNCYISYLINPARVLGGRYVDTFNSNMTAALLSSVNGLLEEISPLLPKIDYSRLKRVDFCRNIQLSDSDKVKCYIELAKRALNPKGYGIKPLANRDGKEYFPDNSVTFVKGHTSIVLYDKYSQMQRKPKYFSEEETEDAYGVLRVEIQVEKTKLYYIRQKNDIDSITGFLTQADKLATGLFNYHLYKFFLKGEYQTFPDAIEAIDKSEYKPKAKDDMRLILKYVSDFQSLNKGIEFLNNNGYKRDKLNRLLIKFDELGVNPVTLPRRWGYKNLPNIAKLVCSSK